MATPFGVDNALLEALRAHIVHLCKPNATSLTQVAEALSAQLGKTVSVDTVLQGLRAHAQIGTQVGMHSAETALAMAETTVAAAEAAAQRMLAKGAEEAAVNAARQKAREAVLQQGVRQVATRGIAATVASVLGSLSVFFWILLALGVAGLIAAGVIMSRGDKPIEPGPAMTRPRPSPPPSEETTGGGTTTPLASPVKFENWVRRGPFFASNNQEGRKPQRLEVGDESLSFMEEAEGKTYKNTLMWTPPPETLQPGQEVMLTLSATSNERAMVGGWWNINCQINGKGDTSAGSPKEYRLTGSPDPHSATYTFKFAPASDPYIQLSAGRDPAPDTWVLVTYKYERQDLK